MDRLGSFLEIAKGSGVDLCHENEKGIFGDTYEKCLMLHKALPTLPAVFDPANFVQCDEDTITAFEKLKPYIGYVHIKDSLKEDKSIVPAGKGDANIEYILKSLYENGYDGFLSLEPHLGSFEGLKDLELDNAMLKLPKGGEGTFTAAHNALNKILERITEAQNG